MIRTRLVDKEKPTTVGELNIQKFVNHEEGYEEGYEDGYNETTTVVEDPTDDGSD